jgi:hypothetical protein
MLPVAEESRREAACSANSTHSLAVKWKLVGGKIIEAVTDRSPHNLVEFPATSSVAAGQQNHEVQLPAPV